MYRGRKVNEQILYQIETRKLIKFEQPSDSKMGQKVSQSI